MSCSRGVSSRLREGSVQSLRIKMEQCRNSLAGRYGKRASSSGGASPLPLFHFLFLLLLLDCVDQLCHLRLPPGSPLGHRHGYCSRLILRLELLSMRHEKQRGFFYFHQTFPKYKTDLKNYQNKNAGRALTQEQVGQRLFISVFNTLSLKDKKKKKKKHI